MRTKLISNASLLVIMIPLIIFGCNKTPEPVGRHSDTLAVSTVTSKNGEEVATEIFKVQATVTKIDRGSGKITLDHQRIPAYMDTMSMTSALADSSIFNHVHVGSIGLFTLRVKNKIPEVTKVETYIAKKNIAQENAGTTYRVLAKVTGIDKAEGMITIDHEKMDGFMDAMEMPYKVSDPSLCDRVKVGTEGHFTIRVVNGEGTIISIHVHH